MSIKSFAFCSVFIYHLNVAKVNSRGMFSTLQIFSTSLLIILLASQCSGTGNETEPSPASLEVHSREKRLLTFAISGGVLKVVAGAVYPVVFNHKLRRSLNGGINLQANYRILADIIWPVPEDIFTNRMNKDYTDDSRAQFYRVLERMVDNMGRKGKDCLLRTICDLAETPLSHNGMIGELIDLVFTPSATDKLEEEYLEARKYGLNGVKCSEAFKTCPYGHSLLDAISTVVLPLVFLK
ncbi:uncharacterized protein LOC134224334 [Armigeres subalbatus]|uniref:uncharacterized protein LOC134224334 n=1 Tax=Armigeres subalbatus TaxID=124917 RepID=UPI002ED42C58